MGREGSLRAGNNHWLWRSCMCCSARYRCNNALMRRLREKERTHNPFSVAYRMGCTSLLSSLTRTAATVSHATARRRSPASARIPRTTWSRMGRRVRDSRPCTSASVKWSRGRSNTGAATLRGSIRWDRHRVPGRSSVATRWFHAMRHRRRVWVVLWDLRGFHFGPPPDRCARSLSTTSEASSLHRSSLQSRDPRPWSRRCRYPQYVRNRSCRSAEGVSAFSRSTNQPAQTGCFRTLSKLFRGMLCMPPPPC